MHKPLILVDGSSYFFRAYHALPPLLTSHGQPTGAIYGVVNMIKRLLKDYDSSEIAVIFDAPGPTFRSTWFPDYKAHRPPVPQDLSCQFQPLVQILQALGLPILIIPDVEADDVIGTYARLATERAWPVLISTSDKDLAQLVNEHITLINTMTQVTLDPMGVKNKFGVNPDQMIDYLALVGDTSDNIPGLSKCGAKTAVKWLSEYGTLDHLLANAHHIGGKIGESLRNSFDIIALSKRLVTIKTDVIVPLTLDELVRKPLDPDALLPLVQTMEFKTWLAELTRVKSPTIAEEPTPVRETNYEIITTMPAFFEWLARIKAAPCVCIDTETTGLDIIHDRIVGLSFSVLPTQAAYLPLSHNDGTVQLDRRFVMDTLKPWLEDPAILKVGQNIKYDYHLFKNEGITLQGIAFDTMLESYLLNSTASKHDLDTMTLNYLHHQNITFADIAGTGSKQRRFDDIPVPQAAPYAAEDADMTLSLHHYFYPRLDETLRQLLHDIEMPLVPVLAELERYGVLIDVEQLKTHGLRLKKQIKALEEEAFACVGMPFNLSSPKQLQDILYRVLALPIKAKTPTGQPSTAESVLEELAHEYRLPAIIVEHRQLSKLVSTYIDALPKRVDPQTSRVHTSYNQAVTATGRLSSSEPNLQNIPIRREEGRLIRRAFIAPPEHVILAADYSQIELRIMAHLSQDPQLLYAFSQGWDIHAATASEIFSVPLSEVTDEQRRRAKAVNFGLMYGMSAFGLAKQLDVDRHDAQFYLDRYFQRYSGVKDFMDRTRATAHDKGYVETLFGRRLHLPDIHSHQALRRKAAERMAINAPMQGTAADLIKKAMINIAAWQKSEPRVHMIMQVHDELVFEVHQDAIDVAQATIKEYMENTSTLSVPLIVSMGIGKNWDEAH